jgi:hypothetical protein
MKSGKRPGVIVLYEGASALIYSHRVIGSGIKSTTATEYVDQEFLSVGGHVARSTKVTYMEKYDLVQDGDHDTQADIDCKMNQIQE